MFDGGFARHSLLCLFHSKLVCIFMLFLDTVRPFDPDEYDYDFNSELEDTIRTK